VVLINNLAAHNGGHTYSIGVDNHHGGYVAARHLIERGHRRIAYLSAPADRSDSAARQRGYEKALAEAGLDPDPSLIVQGTGRAGGGQRALPVLRSMADPPSAALCYNDMTAIGLMNAMRAAGLSIPEDLAIVGFDDICFAQLAYPPLTTIAQPVDKLGEGAVEMVLTLLSDDDGRELPETNVTICGRLVVRASSG
jgi:DNA-binding LacI/PurR family transcriptional regulator